MDNTPLIPATTKSSNTGYTVGLIVLGVLLLLAIIWIVILYVKKPKPPTCPACPACQECPPNSPQIPIVPPASGSCSSGQSCQPNPNSLPFKLYAFGATVTQPVYVGNTIGLLTVANNSMTIMPANASNPKNQYWMVYPRGNNVILKNYGTNQYIALVNNAPTLVSSESQAQLFTMGIPASTGNYGGNVTSFSAGGNSLIGAPTGQVSMTTGVSKPSASWLFSPVPAQNL